VWPALERPDLPAEDYLLAAAGNAGGLAESHYGVTSVRPIKISTAGAVELCRSDVRTTAHVG